MKYLKSYRHIRKKTIYEIVDFIEKYKSKYIIKLICKILKFSRSTYYKVLVRVPLKRQFETYKLKVEIHKIYTDSKGRYGVPKIYKTLKNNGKMISLKRVKRYMSSIGLRSIVVKKFHPYFSKSAIEERDHHLNRNFQASSSNQKWWTIITYIHTYKRWRSILLQLII